jgi:hypothetical protein
VIGRQNKAPQFATAVTLPLGDDHGGPGSSAGGRCPAPTFSVAHSPGFGHCDLIMNMLDGMVRAPMTERMPYDAAPA